jgi:hypothetical protein
VDKVPNLLLNLLALPVKKYKYWRRDKEAISLEVEACLGIGDKALSLLALLVEFTWFTSVKVQIRTQGAARDTQFTCFTSTKVQILTQTALCYSKDCGWGTPFTCFTSTKVQILTQMALCYSKLGLGHPDLAVPTFNIANIMHAAGTNTSVPS